jgi:hypothetical protein
VEGGDDEAQRRPQEAQGQARRPSQASAEAAAGQPAYDHAKVVRLNQDVSRAFENMKVIPMKLFLDSNRVNGLKNDLAKFRETVAAFPPGSRQREAGHGQH